MKNTAIIIVLVFSCTISYCQQWLGSANSTGSVYRGGAVGIGVTIPPVLVNGLTVGGVKSVFGANNILGNYPSAASALEIQNNVANGESFFQMYSGVGANYINLSLSVSMPYGVGITVSKGTSATAKDFGIWMTSNSGGIPVERLRVRQDGKIGIGNPESRES